MAYLPIWFYLINYSIYGNQWHPRTPNQSPESKMYPKVMRKYSFLANQLKVDRLKRYLRSWFRRPNTFESSQRLWVVMRDTVATNLVMKTCFLHPKTHYLHILQHPCFSKLKKVTFCIAFQHNLQYYTTLFAAFLAFVVIARAS